MAAAFAEELVVLYGHCYAATEAGSSHAIRELRGIVAFRITGGRLGHIDAGKCLYKN